LQRGGVRRAGKPTAVEGFLARLDGRCNEEGFDGLASRPRGERLPVMEDGKVAEVLRRAGERPDLEEDGVTRRRIENSGR